jgi:hypothetical protein
VPPKQISTDLIPSGAFSGVVDHEGNHTILAGIAICAAAFAQAPSGLTVKAATSKKVDLNWTGTAPGYTVQRAVLGGSFSNLATVTTGATYSDTSIDAYTTYQYQIVANPASGASSPSNQVTVGPPPQRASPNPHPRPAPPAAMPLPITGTT